MTTAFCITNTVHVDRLAQPLCNKSSTIRVVTLTQMIGWRSSRNRVRLPFFTRYPSYFGNRSWGFVCGCLPAGVWAIRIAPPCHADDRISASHARLSACRDPAHRLDACQTHRLNQLGGPMPIRTRELMWLGDQGLQLVVYHPRFRIRVTHVDVIHDDRCRSTAMIERGPRTPGPL